MWASSCHTKVFRVTYCNSKFKMLKWTQLRLTYLSIALFQLKHKHMEKKKQSRLVPSSQE